METTREGNPYDVVSEEGLGTGGKFRKRPFRRTTHTTPYDRPPTALRNPSIVGTANNNSNGWLSRLVDPAQRLIASSAHRIFSSVFRKRLTQPPPPLQQPQTQPFTSESKQEVRDNHQDARDQHHEAVVIDSAGMQQKATDRGDKPSSSSDRGGLTELEQILKQKTFTRSEIDRLTALLHSKSDDVPIGHEEKKSEVIPPEPAVSHERKEEFPITQAFENTIGSSLISTPVISSRVLDEDVASPAELAKAYMGSRPSKVSPSMLGIRNQAYGEESTMISSQPFPPKSSIMPLVPRSPGNAGYPENGFTTPRSRGKSAIYSMGRTPYSRVDPTSTHKGFRPIVAYDGLSSSSPAAAAWEQNKLYGSRQGALKRRGSVLYNDIGPVGPIRRIRHKPSLLSSRGLSLPVSDSGVVPGAAQYPSSSTQKPLLLEKSKENSTKMSIENGDNSVPGTSFTSVPTKSSEMASKILQQLEKLVSPKEKSSYLKVASVRDSSPTKLSPSMLHGRALRSLETVESPKFLENVRDNRKMDISLDTSLPDALDTTSQRQNKDENVLLKLVAPCDRSVSVVNCIDYKSPNKDTLPSVKTTNSAVMNFVTLPPQKKQAFQMSAHEDYFELDDDSPDGAALVPLVKEREKVDFSVVGSKIHDAKAVTLEKPPSLMGFKPPSSSELNQTNDLVSSDGPVVAEKSTGFAFPKATFTNTAVQPSLLVTQPTLTSDKSVSPAQLNVAPPMYDLEDKVASSKEPNATSRVASFLSVSSADNVPKFVFDSSSSASESSSLKFGVCSGKKPEISDSGNSSATTPAAALTSINGSVSLSTLAVAAPSFSATPIFNFGSTGPLTSVSPVTDTSGVESEAAKTRPETSFGNLKSSPFAGTSGANASSGSSIFYFGPAATTSTANNQSGSSVFGTGNESVQSAKASFAGTGVSSLTNSMPVQCSSSAPSFGLAGNTAFSSGSSLFSASTTAKLFSSGSASSPEASSSSAMDGSASSLFSSSWPATKPPIFGSAINSISTSAGSSFSASTASVAAITTPSTGFSFSASTASVPATTLPSSVFSFPASKASVPATTLPSTGFSFPASTASVPATISPSTGFSFAASTAFAASTPSTSVTGIAPVVFGSSIGASSGPTFSFTPAMAAPSSQPVFGNPNSGFTFNSASSGNNDQMNMEDSMAEDTFQAPTPTVPVFGQPLVSPPQSNFVFGSTTPSAPNNPFQFGAQQSSATSQNQPPFQATNSLGGSFSVGAGGGDKSGRKIIKVNRNKTRKK
ncbi:hypothetical protein I3842_13G045400 [Carya illinoinensis]|uniref:Nuclear pore complex protein NUP1-like n=1 Tax=Carya illinoinensis TaxID=32201 RepID=A0A922AFP2_CARIL|nr:hypothetical protein I3842_13G045400 [Carya illinoinensis]